MNGPISIPKTLVAVSLGLTILLTTPGAFAQFPGIKPVVLKLQLTLWPTSQGPALATQEHTVALYQEVQVHRSEAGELSIRPLTIEARRYLRIEVREEGPTGSNTETIRIRLRGSDRRRSGEMEAALKYLGDRLHIVAAIQP